VPQHVHQLVLQPLVVLAAARGLLDEVGADVRRHDDDGVAEVDRAALAVGEPPVVEHLQESVEDVGVGLLDLVEEDDRVWPPAHGLGQLAALVVADVARGRADQAGHRVLLHVLRHVEAHERVLVVEQELGERSGELGLADAGRAHEEEGADRPAGVAEAGPGPADGVRHEEERFVLAHHALAEAVLDVEQLLHLALEEAGDGDARPLRDHLGHVLGVHLLLEHLLLRLQLGQLLVLVQELLLELGKRPVLELRGFREVALASHRVDLEARLLDLLLGRADLLDRRLLLLPVGLHPGRGLAQLGDLLLDL